MLIIIFSLTKGLFCSNMYLLIAVSPFGIFSYQALPFGSLGVPYPHAPRDLFLNMLFRWHRHHLRFMYFLIISSNWYGDFYTIVFRSSTSKLKPNEILIIKHSSLPFLKKYAKLRNYKLDK